MKRFIQYIFLLITVAVLVGCGLVDKSLTVDLQRFELQGKVKEVTLKEYSRWDVDYKFGKYTPEEGEADVSVVSFNKSGDIISSAVYFSNGELMGGVENTYEKGKLISSLPPEDGSYISYRWNSYDAILYSQTFLEKQNIVVTALARNVEYSSKDETHYTLFSFDGSLFGNITDLHVDKNTREVLWFDKDGEMSSRQVRVYTKDNTVEVFRYARESEELTAKERIIFLSDLETEIFTYSNDGVLLSQTLESFNKRGQLVGSLTQELGKDGEIKHESLSEYTYNDNGDITSRRRYTNGEFDRYSNYDYEYLSYDKQGNWTRRVIFAVDKKDRNLDKLEDREITYY